MNRTTKILRLLVAAMIGAGIALLWYLFLLLGAERRIPMWLFGSAGVLLLCICYYGFTVAVRKAKP